METVKSAGYSPMMYASKNGYANNWETDRLSNRYKIWVAQYPGSVNPVTDKSSYTGKHQMWQYTSKGSVPGISGNVDMNVAYFKYTGTPDASVTNVKFVVKDNSGKAVKGATVQMAGATTNSAITDETGTAVFTYVPFGDYTVTVSGVPVSYTHLAGHSGRCGGGQVPGNDHGIRHRLPSDLLLSVDHVCLRRFSAAG